MRLPLARIAAASLFVLSLVCLRTPLQAASAVHEFTFSQSDLRFAKKIGFDWLSLPGCEPVNVVGEPTLPAKVVHLSVPQGMEADSVEIVFQDSEVLPGQFNLFPGQRALPTSVEPTSVTLAPPDPTVYSRTSPYPARPVDLQSSGSLGGYSLVTLRVYPLQYIPALGRLSFISRLQVRISLRAASHPTLAPPSRLPAADSFYESMVRSLVANPLEVAANSGPHLALTPQDSTAEYLIITDEEYDSTFQALADWKTRRGVRAQVLTVPLLYALYPGNDQADKVRNCIIDYYVHHGTMWVLLGGDITKMPMRYGYSNFQGENATIPADWYFSCLDGTWNANNNDLYGEVADNTDLYPDVFVGRAPVDNLSQAQTFVNKVLAYEKALDPGYQNRMLFLGEMLDGLSDTGAAKDTIDNQLVPAQFDPIAKLYASRGNENVPNVVDSLNVGFNIVNHDGHGNNDYMGVGQGGLTGTIMYGLTNSPRFTILYSLACISAGFDYEDCIAERFVNAPQGGGFFIGNSRYGWYLPGTPPGGAGAAFDYQLYVSLFPDNFPHLGQILADSKVYFAGTSQTENDYRWTEFTLNLLGDPETPVWTDLPRSLQVVLADSIPCGASNLTVSISSLAPSSPVDSALVCLLKPNEIYATGYTNALGFVTLPVNPATAGPLYVTVTGRNCVPVEDSVQVVEGMFPYLFLQQTLLDDSAGGNGDGTMDAGETVDLAVWVKNSGLAAAQSVAGVLRSASPQLALLDSNSSYGDLAPGSTSPGDAYRFRVDSSASEGEWMPFSLVLTANDGAYRSELPLAIQVASRYDFADHDLSDLRLTITTDGSLGYTAPGDSGRGLRYPRDSGRSLLYQGSFFLGTAPDRVADGWGSSTDWVVTASPDGRLKVVTSGDTLQTSWTTYSDSGLATPQGIEVRQLGSARSGTDYILLDYHLANRSPVRLHGIYAALFMDFDIFADLGYIYNLAGVDTIRNLAYVKWSSLNPLAGICPILMDSVANVSVIDNSIYLPGKVFPDSLKFDFMRGDLRFQNGMAQRDWSVIVSCGPFSLDPGASDSVAFAVVGGNTLAELQAAVDAIRTGISVGGDSPEAPLGYGQEALLEHHPEPFTGRAEIRYIVPTLANGPDGSVPVSLCVYNIAGQVVRTLARGSLPPGAHTTRWDGRNDGGRQASSGLYFLRLAVGRGGNSHTSATSRMVLLR